MLRVGRIAVPARTVHPLGAACLPRVRTCEGVFDFPYVEGGWCARIDARLE